MADKLTQLMIEGMTQAAANRGAYPQFASKTEPGLFPNNTLGKSAAQKCLDDQLLKAESLQSTRPRLIATEKGLQFLLDASSPKQVLEDFVRVLESRQAQVDELLATTRQMSDALHGLHMSLATILPKMTAQRLNRPRDETIASKREPLMTTVQMNGTSTVAEMPPKHSRHQIDEYSEELTEAIVARLMDWADSPGVARDCPLPELFRSLSTCHRSLTIGEFHDCLRLLQSESRVYLHPWTGPLYELPEPAFALMCGHEIAYYVSARTT